MGTTVFTSHKFGVDDGGFIITEVSPDKITEAFKPIVKNILNSIVQTCAHDLDSVYLYGSVATGKAVIGKSDIDLILLFKAKPAEALLTEVSDLAESLSKIYASTLREVGLGVSFLDELHSDKERFGLLCFLKHLCVCISGPDATGHVEKFKPSKDVAIGFNGDIEKSLKLYREKIENSVSESNLKSLSQSLAKKILRTGFSLVMPRLESWTTELQTAYDSFIKFYPEKTTEMSVALVWSESGSTDKEALIAFIDSFGAWLTQEFRVAIARIGFLA